MKVWVIFQHVTYGKYEDAYEKVEILRVVDSEEKARELEQAAELFKVSVDIEEVEVY